jgi:Ca2+-binding EF-hand superfamily protein
MIAPFLDHSSKTASKNFLRRKLKKPQVNGNPIMMRMIFALMDTDGDGTIELPEFQAAHERIFKAMDSNKDGRLTLEEMETFMHGTATAPATPPAR